MNSKLIRMFFDQQAADWDANVELESLERLAAIMVDLDIRYGCRVLDVGAGTGVLFPLLAPRLGDNGLIVAVDLSEKMLRQAKSRRCDVRVSCLVADAMQLPLFGAFFDWVFCYNAFPHFEDQRQGLMEFARVLGPKGRLVICHTKSRDAVNAFHRSLGGLVADHTLPDAGEMEKLLRNAGLRHLRFEDRPERYLVIAEHSLLHPGGRVERNR